VASQTPGDGSVHVARGAVEEPNDAIALGATRADADAAPEARLATADERDSVARVRDLTAGARDDAADARDVAMTQRDVAYEQEESAGAVTGGGIVIRAAGHRTRAAVHRTESAEQRGLAAADRVAGATDRAQAARERLHAMADREALARALSTAETDPSTGARACGSGLADLARELDRCRRTQGLLVIASIHVAGGRDRAAGPTVDDVLRRLVEVIRTRVRSYDLVIRLGTDELLCAICGVTLAEARGRFSAIGALLAAAPDAPEMKSGFAALMGNQTTYELIAQAHSDLLALRGD
jgi:GGDEF domain-containing protein